MNSLRDLCDSLRHKADEIGMLADNLDGLALEQVPASMQAIVENTGPGAELEVRLRISASGKLIPSFKAWTGTKYTENHKTLAGLMEEISGSQVKELSEGDAVDILVGKENLPY